MVAFVKSRFGELKHRAETLHMVRSFGTFVTESISFRPAAVELALDTTIVVVSPNLVEQWRRETYSVTGESPLALNTAAQVRTYLEKPDNELLVVVNENRYRLFCTLSAVLSVGFAHRLGDAREPEWMLERLAAAARVLPAKVPPRGGVQH